MTKAYVLDIQLVDDHDVCITETHQCPVCCFNTCCSLSIQAQYAEPSASDWNDPTLYDAHKQLRFE